MTLPDPMFFSHGLGAALATPEPAQRVNELVRRVLTTEPAAWESDGHRLLRVIAERLDTVSEDPRRLLVLAQDVKHLIDHASSNDQIELLLELLAERERVLGVMRKYTEGVISRTGFLSFIREQRWPDVIRGRMAALSEIEFASVMKSLEQCDVIQLESILTA